MLISFLTVSQITSQIKANPDKCNLLINTDENVALKIRNRTLTNSFNQKLLGIYKFDFDEHVTSLSRKTSQKLYDLARVVHYINLAQSRLIINAFIFSRFGYCPLVWMFHSKKLNNCINNIYERALIIAFRDCELIAKAKKFCKYIKETYKYLLKKFLRQRMV